MILIHNQAERHRNTAELGLRFRRIRRAGRPKFQIVPIMVFISFLEVSSFVPGLGFLPPSLSSIFLLPLPIWGATPAGGGVPGAPCPPATGAGGTALGSFAFMPCRSSENVRWPWEISSGAIEPMLMRSIRLTAAVSQERNLLHFINALAQWIILRQNVFYFAFVILGSASAKRWARQRDNLRFLFFGKANAQFQIELLPAGLQVFHGHRQLFGAVPLHVQVPEGVRESVNLVLSSPPFPWNSLTDLLAARMRR